MEAPAFDTQFAHELKVCVHGLECSLQGVHITVPGPGLGGGTKGIRPITLEAVPKCDTETQPGGGGATGSTTVGYNRVNHVSSSN